MHPFHAGWKSFFPCWIAFSFPNIPPSIVRLTIFMIMYNYPFSPALLAPCTPNVVVYFALRITNVGNPDQMPLFVTPKHQMWGQVLPSRYVYKRQQQQ